MMIFLAIWIILVLIFGKYEAQSDGFNELGIPFVFYRYFSGKGDYNKLHLGINYCNLIIDLAIVFLISLIIMNRVLSINRLK